MLGEGVDDRIAGKVRPAEPDAVAGGRRRHGHMGISPRVEAFPFEAI
jgi:hypothetical protein